jgi:hypothetical protein
VSGFAGRIMSRFTFAAVVVATAPLEADAEGLAVTPSAA